MRYEILGSLRVTDGARTIPVSGPKTRVVLATLLIRSGQVVPLEELIGEVWGEHPPRRATAALYVYVSQLRKLLGTGGEGPIHTETPGYVLRTEPDELDLGEFQTLAARGREGMRDGRLEQASTAFERALALWRGPALRELQNGPVVSGFTLWLEELRLECTELLVEANLRLGRHRELVGFLQGLVREHPLYEAFHWQLMLALYHSERRADALMAYRSARAVLNRELGLEPGRRMRELQQTILHDTDELDIRYAV